MEAVNGHSRLKRLHAESLIKLGAHEEDVIKEIGISRSTFYEYKKNIRLFGHSHSLPIGKTGRPPLLTREIREVLLKLLSFFYYLYNLQR